MARVIKDYDFDIVGMQEVTGRNGGKSVNPSTGRSQLEDMKAWLTDYSFLEWERSGNNNAKDYSYMLLLIKKTVTNVLSPGASGCRHRLTLPDRDGIRILSSADFGALAVGLR